MKLRSQQKATLLAILAVIFWSTMSSAFKISLRHIAFDQLLFWGSLTGLLVLGTINQSGKNRLRLGNLSKKAVLGSAAMGLFNPFLYYLILFKAYELLDAQEAGTLNYTWPIVLVLLSIPLLKQKIKPLSILAIFISFVGIIIISTQGDILGLHFSNPLGVALAVGSSLLWAIYWIMNMSDNREETGKITLNLFFGLVYMMLYLFISGRGIELPSSAAMIGIAYIGIFEMSITFVIWLKALQYSSDTAKVSNLIYLSPFIALFWINSTVGESIRLSTIVGLVFIISGILLQQIIAGRKAI